MDLGLESLGLRSRASLRSFLGLIEDLFRLLKPCQRFHTLIEIVPALGSENYASRGSPDQRDAQVGLECGEFSTHGGNGHVQGARGPADALQFCNFHENENVI